MVRLFEKIRKHRFGLLVLLALLLITTSLITRIVLLVESGGLHELSFTVKLGTFFVGLFFDFVNATYFVIPLAIYLWIFPERWFHKRWHQYLLASILFLFSFLIIFNSFSEWFFWEEFTTRFNFIAVDYLVYTTEVIGNIRESYPIERYLAGALSLAGLFVYHFRSWTFN